jgi:glycosyltransferase involved in cell wall biosynthesis
MEAPARWSERTLGDQKLSEPHPSILHLYNTAGVACTLAKWTNRIYGVNTDVCGSRSHNQFGHLTYGTEWMTEVNRSFPYILKYAQNFDVIHIHYHDRVIRNIRKHYPTKPLIIHYHGTDIRGIWKGRQRFWGQADAVLVSTPNLLEGAPYGATYLPNPIDTDIFYPTPNKVDGTSALTFPHGAEDVAERLAEEHGLKLTVHLRNTPFLEMPDLLRQFNWYIDTKRNNQGRLLCRRGGSGSMTGLEALACGLKVINSDGDIREGLPPQHRAVNVVKALASIYKNLK